MNMPNWKYISFSKSCYDSERRQSISTDKLTFLFSKHVAFELCIQLFCIFFLMFNLTWTHSFGLSDCKFTLANHFQCNSWRHDFHIWCNCCFGEVFSGQDCWPCDLEPMIGASLLIHIEHFISALFALKLWEKWQLLAILTGCKLVQIFVLSMIAKKNADYFSVIQSNGQLLLAFHIEMCCTVYKKQICLI